MSISTKTGDSGCTSLWSGERVSKDDLRVEVYGTIDELDSFLAEAKNIVTQPSHKGILLDIQYVLKGIMSEIASTDIRCKNPIGVEQTNHITGLIHQLEKNIKIDKLVILGECLISAKLDICRAIARRTERRLVTLSKVSPVSEHILIYFNRLSDLLFLMARDNK